MTLHLDPWQLDFLKTKGDKILCTGRQVGKSVVCGNDAGEYALTHPNHNILMIAPTERQAYGLFEKTLEYIVNKNPKALKMGKDRPTKTKITLKNGAKIWCLPVGVSGLGVRFMTVHRLYADECSRIPEDVFSAVSPSLLTTGGDTIYLSTPAGAQGEFHRCWINEDNAYNSFTRFSNNSEDVMRNRKISSSWTALQRERALQKLEQAKVRMSKREYAQEYLGQFLADLHRWFNDDVIAKCCNSKRRAPNMDKNLYLGVDIARMGEDESSFIILERKEGRMRQIECITTSKTLTTQTEEKIVELDRIYNFDFIYIDAGSGSLGVGIFDHLLKNEQTRRKVIAINNRSRSMDKDNKSKTKLLKEDLYSNLLALMEQNLIYLLDDEDLKASLASVQYEHVMKEGQPTKLRIFGNYTHIAEGLIRAAWGIKETRGHIWIM